MGLRALVDEGDAVLSLHLEGVERALPLLHDAQAEVGGAVLLADHRESLADLLVDDLGAHAVGEVFAHLEPKAREPARRGDLDHLGLEVGGLYVSRPKIRVQCVFLDEEVRVVLDRAAGLVSDASAQLRPRVAHARELHEDVPALELLVAATVGEEAADDGLVLAHPDGDPPLLHLLTELLVGKLDDLSAERPVGGIVDHPRQEGDEPDAAALAAGSGDDGGEEAQCREEQGGTTHRGGLYQRKSSLSTSST